MMNEELTAIRIAWDAAPDAIVQAAEMIAFYAAHPTDAGDPAELEGFRL